MECYELKLTHDACFYKWYNDFLRNKTASPGQPCENEFKAYRSCLETKFKDSPDVLKLKASDSK
jgi:hypothetical protein